MGKQASQKPLRVGITGGIGAGKSLVCRVLRTLGVPIYDADTRAKWLMAHDPKLRQQLADTFGPASFLSDGSLNRKFLAAEVFPDPNKLKQINGLVHPRVGEDFESWCAAQHGVAYLLKEAALLFESGSYRALDCTILVTAPEALRVRRVLARDPHRDEAGVKAIMDKQMSEAEKRALADFCLENDEKAMLLPQILNLHQRLCKGETEQ